MPLLSLTRCIVAAYMRLNDVYTIHSTLRPKQVAWLRQRLNTFIIALSNIVIEILYAHWNTLERNRQCAA